MCRKSAGGVAVCEDAGAAEGADYWDKQRRNLYEAHTYLSAARIVGRQKKCGARNYQKGCAGCDRGFVAAASRDAQNQRYECTAGKCRGDGHDRHAEPEMKKRRKQRREGGDDEEGAGDLQASFAGRVRGFIETAVLQEFFLLFRSAHVGGFG